MAEKVRKLVETNHKLKRKTREVSKKRQVRKPERTKKTKGKDKLPKSLPRKTIKVVVSAEALEKQTEKELEKVQSLHRGENSLDRSYNSKVISVGSREFD